MTQKPHDRDEVLVHLAERILDGQSVDWQGLRRDYGPDAAWIDRFEDIAGIARAYQGEHASGTAVVEPMDPRVGSRWGALEVRERIGKGGFAKVYRAYDPNLAREVALKLVPFDPNTDPSAIERALEEGRRLARVQHQNVVVVHGADVHGHAVGIWTDLVQGRNLKDKVKANGHCSAGEASVVGEQLCSALAALHRVKLIHGDVKPSNVMCRDRDGRIVLVDFGCSFEAHLSVTRNPQCKADTAPTIPRSASPADAARQQAATPLAAAPEILVDNLRPDTAADIYGVGVVLHYMLSGEYPVEAETLEQLVAVHKDGAPMRLRNLRPDLSSAFVQVVERALARNPGDRYATAGELQQALEKTRERSKQRRRVRRTLIAAGVGIAAIVAFAMVLTRPPFTVEASLWREGAAGSERLFDGGRVAAGDEIYLELQGTRDLHVWVVNEDDRGNAYVLHPERQQPVRLEAGRKHRLPSAAEGLEATWGTSDEARSETILVIASQRSMPALDREVADLPRAGADAGRDFATSVPGSGGPPDRGVGHKVIKPKRASGEGVVDRLVQKFGDKQQGDGVWLWRMRLVHEGT